MPSATQLLPASTRTAPPPMPSSPPTATPALYGPFANTGPRYPAVSAAAAQCTPEQTRVRCIAGAARGLDNEQIAAALQLDVLQVRASIETLEGLVGVTGHAARPAAVAYGYRTGMLTNLAPEPARPLGAWLTPRRQAILLLISQGCSDQEIAVIMRCSRKTAANTVAFLVSAFGAYNRAHLIARAYQQQLIDRPLIPLPAHRPTRSFTPQEADVVEGLAAGHTTQQIRTRNNMSARAATRLLASAAEAAGVPPRRGFAAVIDSAHRGGLLTVSPAPLDDRPLLAGRQHQVLIGITHGWSDAEIAQRLYVAYDTVKTATRHLYDSLAAGTRAQAVQKGWEFHLLGAHPDTEAVDPDLAEFPQTTLCPSCATDRSEAS